MITCLFDARSRWYEWGEWSGRRQGKLGVGKEAWFLEGGYKNEHGEVLILNEKRMGGCVRSLMFTADEMLSSLGNS